MPAAPSSPHLLNQKSPPSVLVTGASGTIGRAISLAFAQQGWSVGLHYHRNKAGADTTYQAVKEAGSRGELFQADIGDSHAVHAMVDAYCRVSGTPSAFVCNAGIAASRLVIRQPEEEWAQVVATNLTGTFHCLRAMGAPLLAQRAGMIIVIGSYAGLQGSAGQAAYAASKAGLIGLVKTAAREWGPQNVCVNLVLPGWQSTALAAQALPGADGYHDHVLSRSPTLMEVARTVVHLAGLRDVSGQVWNCDSRNL